MNRTPRVTVVPLEDAGITPDPHNARRHTPRNIGVIEDSMQQDGAGRSILVDQHGVTIAGAGAWEAATQAGIPRAAVIETDGDTLVIVKRTVTPEQRVRLSLADNRATAAVLAESLAAAAEWSLTIATISAAITSNSGVSVIEASRATR